MRAVFVPGTSIGHVFSSPEFFLQGLKVEDAFQCTESYFGSGPLGSELCRSFPCWKIQVVFIGGPSRSSL